MGELSSMAWSIATTRFASTERVKKDFDSLGVEMYCPLDRSLSVIRGRKVETVRPLFPGYVFFDVPSYWERLFKLPSVLGLFLCNGHPLFVRDDEMDRIRETENHRMAEVPKYRFRKGQLVTARLEHPFFGFVGIVERNIEKDRVVVLFDIFGRQTPATIAESELTVA